LDRIAGEISAWQMPREIVNVICGKSIWRTFRDAPVFRVTRYLADAVPRKLLRRKKKGHDSPMKTIVLLTISNIFMTFAWYGHLKYREVPIYKVIVISWAIAFFEYCFQVPANRIGSYEFSAAQLKTIQEVITLLVFSVFSVLYLKQPVRWNHVAGFAMIVGAVGVIFKKW
jgi:uncharacterized protein